MPGVPVLGDPAPLDGSLPGSVAEGSVDRNFGVYLHVPFCRVRCGYCDFNTYTSDELRGAKRTDYASQAMAEVALAASVLESAGVARRAVSTVFFGGGTPTLLPASDLAALLSSVAGTWGLAAGAEVTTEANPDSVDRDYLRALRAAGFTRISFGMQSAVPHVLATLERTHNPDRIPLVVGWAREAGLNVSLDLIYGTPGESLEDWRVTLEYALAHNPDHISAYALIVEEGTGLASRIRRREIAMPSDDAQADMYELADDMLASAGYQWYEVSNWSSGVGNESRHNLAYWRGHDWWGIGPGAHSHIGGVRWWNIRHPTAYADRITVGHSPAIGREVLDERTRQLESVLLGTRIREGFPIQELTALAKTAVAGLIAEELIEPLAAFAGRITLTRRGRLLADVVVRRLTD